MSLRALQLRSVLCRSALSNTGDGGFPSSLPTFWMPLELHTLPAHCGDLWKGPATEWLEYGY